MAPVRNVRGQIEIRDCPRHEAPAVELSRGLEYALDYVTRGAESSEFGNRDLWPNVTTQEMEVAAAWCRKWGFDFKDPPTAGDDTKNALFE